MSNARAYVGPTSPLCRSLNRANLLTWRAIQLEREGAEHDSRVADTLGRAELAMVRYHGELGARGFETQDVPVISDLELARLVRAAHRGDAK